jgi:hypothetical protein
MYKVSTFMYYIPGGGGGRCAGSRGRVRTTEYDHPQARIDFRLKTKCLHGSFYTITVEGLGLVSGDIL